MIKITGHSNFKVYTKKINNELVLIKESDKINKKILSEQMNKQKKMHEDKDKYNVKIPKIINEYSTIDDGIIYSMEYIDDSINIVDFFNKYNFIKVNWLIKKVIDIVEKFIEKSTLQKINFDIINNKLIDIKDKIDNNTHIDSKNETIINSLKYCENNLPLILNTEIPIGTCHGDFTLSNILIDPSNMELYLIDFLNSFIETPLFDIIKLRQDTKYYWILNLCGFDYDKNKCIIILNYIDKYIDNYFQKYDFYNKTYKYFQIINMLRILQYCKHKNIENFLIKTIQSLIEF